MTDIILEFPVLLDGKSIPAKGVVILRDGEILYGIGSPYGVYDAGRYKPQVQAKAREVINNLNRLTQ